MKKKKLCEYLKNFIQKQLQQLAARSVHRSHYILRFELFTFLIHLIVNFIFFGFACNSFAFLSKANQTARQRPRHGEKQEIFEFQFRLQFFRSNICILHTRCVILFVIITNSRLVSNYDLLCKNRVSNWKRSHFESERFNWLNRLDLSVCFMLLYRYFAIFFSSLNASTFFYT